MKNSKFIVYDLTLEVSEIVLLNMNQARIYFNVFVDISGKDAQTTSFVFSIDIQKGDILNFKNIYKSIFDALSECLVDFGILAPKHIREEAVKNLTLTIYQKPKLSDLVLYCEIADYDQKAGLLYYQLTFANYLQTGVIDIFKDFKSAYTLAGYFEALNIEQDIIEALESKCNPSKNESI